MDHCPSSLWVVWMLWTLTFTLCMMYTSSYRHLSLTALSSNSVWHKYCGNLEEPPCIVLFEAFDRSSVYYCTNYSNCSSWGVSDLCNISTKTCLMTVEVCQFVKAKIAKFCNDEELAVEQIWGHWKAAVVCFVESVCNDFEWIYLEDQIWCLCYMTWRSKR